MKIDWDKVNYPEPAFDRFASRRSVVFGRKGIVSASQPLAVEAGLEILRKGGNAGACVVHYLLLRSLSLKYSILSPWLDSRCRRRDLRRAKRYRTVQLRYWRVSCDCMRNGVGWLNDCRDAFCLFYDAQSKTVKAFNGSGRSPEKLTIDYARQQGVTGNSIPASNLNSVTVPGMSIYVVEILPLLTEY